MYNDDIVNEYLAKGDDILQAYYPEKDDKRAQRKFEGSIWYVNMEKHWKRLADEGHPVVHVIDYRLYQQH